MKNTMVLILLSVLSTDMSIGGILAPTTKLDVLVMHEDGTPFEGVAVRASYPGVSYKDNKVYEKETDKEGKVHFTGQTHFPLSLLAKREGYYTSRLKNIPIGEYDRQKKQFIHSDQEATLVLREVQNPIPMYARYKVQAKIPELQKPIGFDLIKGDWVAPYGKGEVADILLKVSGEWNGYRDHDSLLELSFPGKEDGYIPFEANDQSQFRSPYEAPLQGYLQNKTWRKMKRPIEGAVPEWESIDEMASDANYIIRTRTVLDDNGAVNQANYGKIYRDFEFWGATLDDRYGYIVFTYYLNPTPNDRNLEFDPTQNLFTDLTSRERVKDP